MIQRCLGLYPSVQAHHTQRKELLTEGGNGLFGCEGGPEGCPWERGMFSARDVALSCKSASLPDTSHSFT